MAPSTRRTARVSSGARQTQAQEIEEGTSGPTTSEPAQGPLGISTDLQVSSAEQSWHTGGILGVPTSLEAVVPAVAQAVLRWLATQNEELQTPTLPPVTPVDRHSSQTGPASYAGSLRSASKAPMDLGKAPKFTGHKHAKYKAESQREYQIWLQNLEEDHRYFRDTFRRDIDKVYHAMKRILNGSKADTYLETRQERLNIKTCTWEHFKEEMLNAYGPKALRDQENYKKWITMTWKGSARETLWELKSVEQLLSVTLDPKIEILHFKSLAPWSLLFHLRDDDKPETRDELAEALDRIAANKKTHQLADKSRTKQTDSETQGAHAKDKNSGRNKSKKDRKRKHLDEAGETPVPHRRRTETEKAALRKQDFAENRCLHCHQLGHYAKECPQAAAQRQS
jgi:hypothetical protein